MAISLTKTAAQRIAQQLEQNEAQALRFAAKQSGCSGHSYVMDFAMQINDDDTFFESHGVKVVVDAQSLELIDGTQIDYISQGLNQSFKFSNPQSTDECGCGESFAVAS